MTLGALTMALVLYSGAAIAVDVLRDGHLDGNRTQHRPPLRPKRRLQRTATARQSADDRLPQHDNPCPKARRITEAIVGQLPPLTPR